MSRSAGDRWADVSTVISNGLFGLLLKSTSACARNAEGFGDLDSVRCI